MVSTMKHRKKDVETYCKETRMFESIFPGICFAVEKGGLGGMGVVILEV
jgi:hypothetical protein